MKKIMVLILLSMTIVRPQSTGAQNGNPAVITLENVGQIEELAVFPYHAEATAFSYNGQWLATADAGTVQLWETGKQFRLFQSLNFPDRVAGITFSPISDYLAVGTGTHIELWDVNSVRCVTTLEPFGYYSGIAFSPDETLVSAGNVSAAIVWNRSTGEIVATLAHDSVVDAASFSPDGAFLATGGWDGVRLWDVSNWDELYHLTGFEGGVGMEGLAFSPDGTLLAVGVVPIAGGGGGGDLKLFDAHTGNEVLNLGEQNYPVGSVSFNLDGDILVGDTMLWNTTTGAFLAELDLPIEFFGFSTVKFSHDGTLIVISSDGEKDKIFRIWGIR